LLSVLLDFANSIVGCISSDRVHRFRRRRSLDLEPFTQQLNLGAAPPPSVPSMAISLPDRNQWRRNALAVAAGVSVAARRHSARQTNSSSVVSTWFTFRCCDDAAHGRC
jgi:hypothetical protein